MIRLEDLACGYDKKPVLSGVNMDFVSGSFTVLCGPNGCGKSTLIKTASRLLPPIEGRILVSGRDISEYSPRELARSVAVLPQSRDVPAISVEALASHGRFPYLGLARTPGKEDREAVAAAMNAAGVYELRRRSLPSLSGGQRQRAYIAMALAQDTGVIFLDEPTTFLDIGAQFEILELLKRLAGEGRAVVASLHDLSHALHFPDTLAVFGEGRLLQKGAPEEVYASGILEKVFGIDVSCTDGFYYCKSK